MKRIRLILFSLCVFVSLCITTIAGQQRTLEDARALLQKFVAKGADHKALTKPLRPTKADYVAVFGSELGAKLMAYYDPMWERGEAVISMRPTQTELQVWGVATEDMRAWNAIARENAPGGYERIKDSVQPGFTIYMFEFVEPGRTAGMSYAGLVFVNGHWRLMPRPWRAIE